ncbi:MAG TPA: hypothetical protein VF451_01045 [Acidobacteriota bacterium]
MHETLSAAVDLQGDNVRFSGAARHAGAALAAADQGSRNSG